ncbi:hypothetical protein FACS1894102_1270 [Spirochaetia bacterium]|nr:hypothetical protein FACS1894102_1270 [Spirochaetia bacterium]
MQSAIHAISNQTLLSIIFLVAFICFAIFPLLGEILRRRKWHNFRNIFKNFATIPYLDYSMLRSTDAEILCKCNGGYDSITDDGILWIESAENENSGHLSVPVSLKNASAYILHLGVNTEAAKDSEYFLNNDAVGLEVVRFNKISTLTSGAKIFIAGQLCTMNGRKIFAAQKSDFRAHLNTRGTRERKSDIPLIIIFYECPETLLANAVLTAGRKKSTYFNHLTPYSLTVGIFFMLSVIVNYLGRPAYHITVSGAIIAMFSPLFGTIPPGVIFTFLHRKAMKKANVIRLHKDLSRGNECGGMKALVYEILSWFLLVCAVAINFMFAVIIFRYL